MDLKSLPLFVYLLLANTLLMFVPAGYSVFVGQTEVAQAFAFIAVILLTLTVIIAIAMINRKPRSTGRLHLITLLMAYLFLPLFAALPLFELVPSISIGEAYFEMMSSLTTTGATIFERPSELPFPLHLWRSIVGWFGGLIILVAAVSIMEPLNLGGFEIRAQGAGLGSDNSRVGNSIEPSERVVRATKDITPLYLIATTLLAFCLVILGEDGFVAVCHAMAIVSTSGISPVGGLEQANAGLLGELLMLVFLALAISHTFFNRQKMTSKAGGFSQSELKIAVVVTLLVSTLLFMFHFVGIATEETTFTPWRAFNAWWGGFFTTVSFLTTTGFVSDQWGLAKAWANLGNIGLILLVLTILGGGIATTASGIKLLRIYALFKHGERELERLVHPSSVAGSGADARQLRRGGAYVTWMFVMLFVLSIAGVGLALALCGLEFETAFVMAIASLSNTGPLVQAFGTDLMSYGDLSHTARMFLNMSMIIGRMEILAVVAILNANHWRI